MFKRFQGFIDGLGSAKLVFKALVENILFTIVSFKSSIRQLNLTFEIKKNINFSMPKVRESYMFLENPHLEVNTFKGIFLQTSHRLLDTYPHIVLLDKNNEDIEDTKIALSGSFNTLDSINKDITQDDLTNDLTKFGSISLSLVLDEIEGEESLNIFVKQISSLLQPGGVVFGFTIAGKEVSEDSKSYDFIKHQNKNKKWFNMERSLQDIEKVFAKNFHNIGVIKDKDIILFRASTFKEKPDTSKYKPNMKIIRTEKNNKYPKNAFIDQHQDRV